MAPCNYSTMTTIDFVHKVCNFGVGELEALVLHPFQSQTLFTNMFRQFVREDVHHQLV